MAARATHKWAFKPGMRAGAYSWKSSAKAIERLKSASSEIKAVARVDPVTAAEGVTALAQRIWRAFEHIDTSSGALGNAVRRTLQELLPVLIEAPADEKTRAKWLEQLREAIMDDGVDYLAPIADRFGQIAAYPSLTSLHADRDLDIIEAAWSDHARFIHVATGTLTLSCLLEAGRYDELLALLQRKKTRLWYDKKFGAEALLRQGREDEALAYAEALLQDDSRPWGHVEIAQFCERILVAQRREDEAYRRFGLPSASGNTYLAMWRDLVKRYPDIDARRILEDLIDTHVAHRGAAVLAVCVSVPSKKPSRVSEWLGKHQRPASSTFQLAQRRTAMKAMCPWMALCFPGVVIRTGAYQTPSTHRPTGILVRLLHGAGHRKVLADRCIRSRGRHPTVD